MESNVATTEEKKIWGHPRGLFYLFFAELWERFSFYGMRALLTLYMVNVVFEAIMERDYAAAAVYSAYGSLVYASTVIGGRISDTILGMRRSIFLGGILMALGHFTLAIEHDITFYLALALIVVGNGFFKPNISTFVGSLYKEGDPRKDSGFVIFYMGINIGAFVSPLLCGWLGREYGWHYGFGLAGIGMMIGLLFFWSGIKKNVFGDRGRAPSEAVLEKKLIGVKQKVMVPFLAFVAAPVIAWLLSSYKPLGAEGSFLEDQSIVNVIFKLIGITILIYLGYIMYKATLDERKKLFMAVLITLFMTIFWGFHELSGSVITLFADRNVDLFLIDAAQSNAINPVFIILLSIPVSLLFTYLHKRKLNPRTPYKFGLGLVLAGASFYILAISKGSADADGMVPFAYLLVMYFLLSLGELFMSPVGLSKITDLSPKRIVAFMMGVWFLSSAFAFQIVGFIGQQLAVESTDANVGGLDTIGIYTDGFMLIAKYALGAGVIVLLGAPLMKRLMGNVH